MSDEHDENPIDEAPISGDADQAENAETAAEDEIEMDWYILKVAF